MDGLEWLFGRDEEPPPWLLEQERLRGLLEQTLRMRAALDELELVLVRRLRREFVLTWHELGEVLGVSAQTAHRRYAGAVRR